MLFSSSPSESPAIAVSRIDEFQKLSRIDEFPKLGRDKSTRGGYLWTSKLDTFPSHPKRPSLPDTNYARAGSTILLADPLFSVSTVQYFKDYEQAKDTILSGIPIGDFRTGDGLLCGFVLDQSDQPVAAGILSVQPEDYGFWIRYPIGNQRGEFRIDGIPVGKYYLYFYPRDSETYYDPLLEVQYEADHPVAMPTIDVLSRSEAAPPTTLRIPRYVKFFAMAGRGQKTDHTGTAWILHKHISRIEIIEQRIRSGEDAVHPYIDGRHEYTVFKSEVGKAAILKFRVDQLDEVQKGNGGLVSIHPANDFGVLLGHTFLSELSQDESKPTIVKLRK